MSVVLRELEGRTYLHVRRKINKVQKQKFINIDGMSREEIALAKHQAKKLDEEWKLAQGELHCKSFISHFFSNGQFKHIRLKEPDKKNGWRIGFILNPGNQKATTCSRSIDQNGFDKAFSQVFARLMQSFNFDPRSQHAKVLASVWHNTLHEAWLDATIRSQAPAKQKKQPHAGCQ